MTEPAEATDPPPDWRVVLAPSALKALARLGRTDRERLERAIDRLPEGDVRPLTGIAGEWRLRVGDWRVRYERDDKQRLINVLLVLPRGEAYKKR